MEASEETLSLFVRFGVALGIGLLIGLQREYAAFHKTDDEDTDADLFAGVRTFTLFSLLGCGASLLADILDSALVFSVVLLVMGILIGLSYFLSGKNGHLGTTTEVAAVLTILAGALCYWNQLAFAAALAVSITVLLTLKLQTQSLVRNISREDVYATLKFAVISLIILPVLPQEGYGPPPFDVLVPYKVWLMVVFISGISFLGYVLIKIVGAKRGVGLTGLLGGLASSTAVTLTFSQRSRDTEELAKPFALAILLAWSMMFVRVLVEVAALNRPLLGIVWIPMVAAMVACLGYCAYLYFGPKDTSPGGDDNFSNPFELKTALIFGFLYGVILIVSNAAQFYFGNTGVYLSSILSGLATVDAVTLSMAELSREGGEVTHSVAARAIVLAAVSNTVIKGGIVMSIGTRDLRRTLLPGMLLTLATAIGVAFFV